jgi:Zn-dependent protease/CBS domain-containing protein
MRLGTLRGIEIRAHWSLAPIAVVIVLALATETLPAAVGGLQVADYWLLAVVLGALFYASLLVHELSHAALARRAGVDVESITLWLFGGVARLRGEAASPRQEAGIAVAGPVASLALGVGVLVAAALLPAGGLAGAIGAGVAWLAAMNLMLGVFNLLPALPLDGGRLLRAYLWQRRGDRTSATLVAARVGEGFGYLLATVGVMVMLFGSLWDGLWLAALGWFLTGAASREETDAGLRRAVAGLSVQDVMTAGPVTVPGWLPVAQLQDVPPSPPHTVFPVRAADGRVSGIVRRDRLAALSSEAAAGLRVADLQVPIAQLATAAPEEALEPALDRMFASREPRLLVLSNGQLIGIVSPVDIARSVRVRSARRRQQAA